MTQSPSAGQAVLDQAGGCGRLNDRLLRVPNRARFHRANSPRSFAIRVLTCAALRAMPTIRRLRASTSSSSEARSIAMPTAQLLPGAVATSPDHGRGHLSSLPPSPRDRRPVGTQRRASRSPQAAWRAGPASTQRRHRRWTARRSAPSPGAWRTGTSRCHDASPKQIPIASARNQRASVGEGGVHA